MSVVNRIAWLAIGALLVGCGSEAANDTVTWVDDGALCLFNRQPEALDMVANDGKQDFAAGDRIYFHVRANACLSSSCDINREAYCDVARSADLLTISSHLSYEPTLSSYCTMDCGMLSATCASDELEAGTYTVRHGAREYAVDVPSSGSICLP